MSIAMDPFPFDDPDGLGADDDVTPAGYQPELPDALLPGEDEHVGSAEDHLWIHDDGRVWDLGPADLDTDADGINDSLTRSGPDGLTVYTDRDHDGQVDSVTEVAADGSFSAASLDPDSGRWVPTDSGRLE